MKIKIINPNTTQYMTDNIEMCGRKAAAIGTEVYAVSPETGPSSLECYVDEALAVPGVLTEIVKGDREENVDAYIIACFGDPGLHAAKEITNKPVVGIAEAGIAVAKMISPNFSIITVLDRSVETVNDMVHMHGAQKFCRSIRSTGLGVLEFDKDKESGLEALRYQSELAIKEDGAECILLGCAGFTGFVEDLRNQLGVPIYDGVAPAVKMAEALYGLNASISKVKTWSKPEKKEYRGFSFLEG